MSPQKKKELTNDSSMKFRLFGWSVEGFSCTPLICLFSPPERLVDFALRLETHSKPESTSECLLFLSITHESSSSLLPVLKWNLKPFYCPAGTFKRELGTWRKGGRSQHLKTEMTENLQRRNQEPVGGPLLAKTVSKVWGWFFLL